MKNILVLALCITLAASTTFAANSKGGGNSAQARPTNNGNTNQGTTHGNNGNGHGNVGQQQSNSSNQSQSDEESTPTQKPQQSHPAENTQAPKQQQSQKQNSVQPQKQQQNQSKSSQSSRQNYSSNFSGDRTKIVVSAPKQDSKPNPAYETRIQNSNSGGVFNYAARPRQTPPPQQIIVTKPATKVIVTQAYRYPSIYSYSAYRPVVSAASYVYSYYRPYRIYYPLTYFVYSVLTRPAYYYYSDIAPFYYLTTPNYTTNNYYYTQTTSADNSAPVYNPDDYKLTNIALQNVILRTLPYNYITFYVQNDSLNEIADMALYLNIRGEQFTVQTDNITQKFDKPIAPGERRLVTIPLQRLNISIQGSSLVSAVLVSITTPDGNVVDE